MPERKRVWLERRWIATALLMDALLVNLGIVLAFFLRFQGTLPRFNFQAYTNLFLVITLIQLFAFYVYGLYERERPQELWTIVSLVVKAVSLGTVLIVSITFFVRFFSFPRSVFALSWLFLVGFISGWRLLFARWFPFEIPSQRVLVIGVGEPAKEVVGELKKRTHWGYELVGLVSTTAKRVGQHLKGVSVLGSLKDLSKLVKELDVDRVIVTSPVKHRELLESLAKSEEAKVKVDVIPELYEIFIGKVDHTLLGDIPLVELTRKPVPDWVRLTKRLFDVSLANLFLILSLPLLLIIALAIKLSSPGPALFKQERVGEKEAVFWLYKFRTMIPDAEAETGPVLAMENDSRVTPLGHFLRRYRLDELPQLYNIIKGEMSFVGPRPERPYFVQQFKKSIPGYSERFQVKPGITGLAQVSSGYATTARNKLKYDLIYIYNQSFSLDLKILFQTIKVVLLARGSV